MLKQDAISNLAKQTGIWETEFCGMETPSRIRRQEAENPLKWLPQTGLGRANAL